MTKVMPLRKSDIYLQQVARSVDTIIRPLDVRLCLFSRVQCSDCGTVSKLLTGAMTQWLPT